MDLIGRGANLNEDQLDIRVPVEHANVSEVPYFVDYHRLRLRRTSSHVRAFCVCVAGATELLHIYALFPSSGVSRDPVLSSFVNYSKKSSSTLLSDRDLLVHIW